MRTQWTKELIHKEALKYSTRSEFERNNKPAYKASVRRGIMDTMCSHMTPLQIKWTKELIHKEALKYSTRSEFKRFNCAAVGAAERRGIMNDVCSHMIKPKRKTYKKKYGEAELYNEALKYNTRTEFKNKNINMYYACLNYGVLEKVCNHMVKGKNGFNPYKSAILYYLSIDNGTAYKIGITNRTIKQRFSNTDLEKLEVLKTWDFPLGKDAQDKERNILRVHKYAKYKGVDLLEIGNSELFDRDILGLDTLKGKK